MAQNVFVSVLAQKVRSYDWILIVRRFKAIEVLSDLRERMQCSFHLQASPSLGVISL